VDGGKSFNLQENWVQGIDFNNEILYSESINIALNFGVQTIFRLNCNASNNQDKLYIDEVQINSCVSQKGMAFSAAKKDQYLSMIIKEN